MEDLMSNAIQSGFSVAVAAFLLIRTEKRLESLAEAIRDLHSWCVQAVSGKTKS